MQELKSKNHSIFRLQYHIVMVMKYRHNALTSDMLDRLTTIFDECLSAWQCDLLESNGEADHVHLLIDAHPSLNLSSLISNLKSVSARKMRKEYNFHLKRFYWKPYFWSRSYCVITAGGASLDILREYIENQSRPN